MVERLVIELAMQGKIVDYSVRAVYGPSHTSIPEELICIIRVDGQLPMRNLIINHP
jgi:hypothetical protein